MVRMWVWRVSAVILLLIGTAYGEYRTPGTGDLYTLEELALFAGEVLQETDFGLVLHDQLIISASDTLEIAGGELYVATVEAHEVMGPYGYPIWVDIVPCIMIEGTLNAQGWTVKPVPGAKREELGHGVVVTGLGHEGAAEAMISDCTFQGLVTGLTVRGGGSADVTGCRFDGLTAAGAATHMDGDLLMRRCSFRDTGFGCTSASLVRLEDCRFEGDGITLIDTLTGSLVTGCTVLGREGIGIDVVGDSRAVITGCQVGGFDYGTYFHSATGTRLEDNAIFGNHESAVVFEATSTPVLRRNRIMYNALGTGSPAGEHPRPGILVMDGGSPDLGTAGDHGLNVIRYNGDVGLYQMGSETVSAVGNDWGTVSEPAVEDMIYHLPDDGEDADGSGSISGLVIFAPIRNLGFGFPSPDLDLSGTVDSKDVFIFQRDWHQSVQ